MSSFQQFEKIINFISSILYTNTGIWPRQENTGFSMQTFKALFTLRSTEKEISGWLEKCWWTKFRKFILVLSGSCNRNFWTGVTYKQQKSVSYSSKSRSRHQQIWSLVRAWFLAKRQPTSHCVPTRQKGWGVLYGLFFKGSIPLHELAQRPHQVPFSWVLDFNTWILDKTNLPSRAEA